MTSEQIGIILMPFTYALIGWGTNWLALKMTFYPLKFWGIPPYLGWQGIVPRKATHLALKSVQTITTHIVKVEEFFSKIDPVSLKDAIHPLLHAQAEEHLRSHGETIPEWKKLSESEKEAHVLDIEKHTETIVLNIATQLRDETPKVFNFKTFFVKNLTKDNARLIVELFVRIGGKEFTFIERSGIYFGFLFGLVQAGIWLIYPATWTLPILGGIVGFATNWLALVMIFRPLYEKRYLGVPYQGLFLKRQDQVSEAYSSAIASEVMQPRKILEEVLYRKIANELMRSMEDRLANLTGQKEYHFSDHDTALENIVQSLAPATERMEKLMARSMNVQKVMYERMREMPPEEFEPILRSAFKEDEYILIIIGAALGAVVGLAQAFYMIATLVK